MLFLEKILKMASEIGLKDVKPPDCAVQNGEKVVGVLTDDLKRLYAILVNAKEKTEVLHKLLSRKINQLGDERTRKQEKQMIREDTVVHLEEDLIHRIFWTCVRLELPDVGMEDIGMRKDWQVVLVDPRVRTKTLFTKLLEDLLQDSF